MPCCVCVCRPLAVQGGNSMQALGVALQELRLAAATARTRGQAPVPSAASSGKTPQQPGSEPGSGACDGALDVVVVHEDLPTNDFSSLLRLLHDPCVSYIHAVQPSAAPMMAHACGPPARAATAPAPTAPPSLEHAPAAALLPALNLFPYMAGRDMYEQLCPPGSIHLAFAFSAFHWLPAGQPRSQPHRRHRRARAGACSSAARDRVRERGGLASDHCYSRHAACYSRAGRGRCR